MPPLTKKMLKVFSNGRSDVLTMAQKADLRDAEDCFNFYLACDKATGVGHLLLLHEGEIDKQTLFTQLQEKEVLTRIADLVEAIQDLLPTLYECKGLYARQLIRLHNLFEEYPLVQDRVVYEKGNEDPFAICAEEDNADRFISRQDMQFVVRPGLHSLIFLLVEELAQAAQNPQRLARCEGCECLFLRAANKPQQIFCSHRCSNRIGTRKRREQQKILGQVRQANQEIEAEIQNWRTGTHG